MTSFDTNVVVRLVVGLARRLVGIVGGLVIGLDGRQLLLAGDRGIGGGLDDCGAGRLGGALVLMPRFEAEEFLQLIEREQIERKVVGQN